MIYKHNPEVSALLTAMVAYCGHDKAHKILEFAEDLLSNPDSDLCKKKPDTDLCHSEKYEIKRDIPFLDF